MSVATVKALIFTCSDPDCTRRAERVIIDPNTEDQVYESVLDKGWTVSDGQALCEIHSGRATMFQGRLVSLDEKPKDRRYWTIPGEECGCAGSGLCSHRELYEADENCRHRVESAQGGGIKCVKCLGWFCA